MKRALLLFWILWGFRPAYALDAAFVKDGAVVAAPVEMPVVGVRLDTGATVYNLHGADSATRAACGYLPLVRFDRSTVPTNKIVVARSWKIEGGAAVEVATLADKPTRITLSRRKLARIVKNRGWQAQFAAYLQAEPYQAVRWYSEERLVAGTDSARDFVAGFAAAVGLTEAQTLKLMEAARED